MSIINRNIRNIIIIDNNEINFSKQWENGVLVKSWYGDKNDCSLVILTKFLLKLDLEKINDIWVVVPNLNKILI